MMKYAIKLTKGNNEKILAIYDRKEEAFSEGGRFSTELSIDAEIISCIYADFDEKNRIVGGKYQLLNGWF